MTIVEVEMDAVGFDESVARANGYAIVTEEDGTQRSVPVTDQARAEEEAIARRVGAGRSTVVAGSCGTSRIVITDSTGFRRAGISTSFNVVRPAVGYSWFVDVAGGGTSARQTFGGALASRTTWQHTFLHSVPKAGSYIASVARTSNAVLNNGTICFSGGPSDVSWVS
ncbi:hypothetical protein [Cellulomonas sp. IC4_254]|uniref:hypothetical protein n=1 Tax=Cellulomonas sp. IC4_254 TaxID=2714040 RepID=UPI001422EEC8|nr:hypothetical protein [Cellulomonas sp. IC4_254]NHT17508.1 hypothetical protein [Cellulomonas sp. IC4_254]